MPMKTNYKLAVAMLASITLGAVPQGYAQGPGAHSTVTPDQLQWKDVPALGPGVKLAFGAGAAAGRKVAPIASPLTGIQRLNM